MGNEIVLVPDTRASHSLNNILDVAVSGGHYRLLTFGGKRRGEMFKINLLRGEKLKTTMAP